MMAQSVKYLITDWIIRVCFLAKILGMLSSYYHIQLLGPPIQRVIPGLFLRREMKVIDHSPHCNA
jgi:hypothetical protein